MVITELIGGSVALLGKSARVARFLPALDEILAEGRKEAEGKSWAFTILGDDLLKEHRSTDEIRRSAQITTSGGLGNTPKRTK